MVLPAHRVIGHKEYGNVGHPGRKIDPVYDMNWRRSRVASFQPRGATPTTPDTPSPEDDVLTEPQSAQLAAVEKMSQAILRQLGVAYQLGGPKHGTVTVPGWPQLGGRTLVDAIAFLLKQDDQPVDVEQIATAVASSVADKLDGQTAATKEDVVEAVRSVFTDAGTA